MNLRTLHPPPLDPGFSPLALYNRAFEQAVRQCGDGAPLSFALQRSAHSCSHFSATLFPQGHPRQGENFRYAERLLKSLLWTRGAGRVYVSGPPRLTAYLQGRYGPGGARHFDAEFLGRQVYPGGFAVIPSSPADFPPENEPDILCGRSLKGCRIGFDLGASDIKVSAVVDGQVVFSQEIIWEPVPQADPAYHRQHIRDALLLAARHLPRVDAIGGSAAGIYIDNTPRVASLFRGIPPDRFDEVRRLFHDLQSEWNVPLEILNDGDVAALAGSMSLGVNPILGIALGSSEAGGYVDRQGNLTGWLNELGFTPIDASLNAVVEAWSGDRGCGSSYLSQQGVFRLAPRAGISLPEGINNARRLEAAQALLESGHEGAQRIWQSIGAYLGYAVAHYAAFYDLEHVLLLGRVTSGRGGKIILEEAGQALAADFPELSDHIRLHLPDEKARRVGQAIAAASLPVI